MAEDVKQDAPEEEGAVTREVLELKLGSLKSDLRLMIIASVALNQLLTNVTLPTELSAAAITAAILAPAVKVGLSLLGRS